jgi:alanine racemase
LLQQNKTRLKFNYRHKDLATILEGETLQYIEGVVNIVIYDTRRMASDRKGVFFALEGTHKSGITFCRDAYEKGCRCFVVNKDIQLPSDANIIKVENTLEGLQRFAKYHRNQFSIPVIGITGSFGKTTVKEWLYYLLKDEFVICRSPKSYNSQIGVAHSLLTIEEHHSLAIIEADISYPNEMNNLEEMIAPTLGVFTGIGVSYQENFENQEHHLNEHLKLFGGCNFTFILNSYHSVFRRRKINAIETSIGDESWKGIIPKDVQFPENRALSFKVAEFLGLPTDDLRKRALSLPMLPGRMEVFEGINNNIIINDAYNIDIDALEQALEYQFTVQKKSKNIVVLSLEGIEEKRKERVLSIIEKHSPDQSFVLTKNEELPSELFKVHDATILFKGSFLSGLAEKVKALKNRKHETWIQFDLKAIKNNLNFLKSCVPKTTKTLVMVKASSYGTGDTQLPYFLQENSVDYLGVAYTDEGATLRENGINLPILVMNTEDEAFEDLVRLCLEPSIFSLDQLKRFASFVAEKGLEDYPIHLKIETGMNRLGFTEHSVNELITFMNKNKSVRLKSVFSHLADADNDNVEFTQEQISKFRKVWTAFKGRVSDDVLFHILNSEGVLKFGKTAAFDMVRLGIALFGYTAQKREELQPVIKWVTTIAQIKELEPGETIGYGRTYTAKEAMKTATLRVGYADGFRRSLSNGVGGVYINGKYCPVVGNVCMDMTMVDVSHVECKPGDQVEIIGENQTMEEFAMKTGTIPYEIMTGINKRVARLYKG